MAKNPTKSLVPGKHNPIERNYAGNLDDSLPSNITGMTGTNMFLELIRLINERSDRNLLPDGNVFSAVLISSIEIKIKLDDKFKRAHACMIPRDVWNAYLDNPAGFSMYKCRIALDFKDCIKPSPDHVSNNPADMKSKDHQRILSYSTAYGVFSKPPEPGELYNVTALNKTKDFCGDEYLVMNKRADYNFEKVKSKKEKLAESGNYVPPPNAGKLPSGNPVPVLKKYDQGSQEMIDLLAAAAPVAGVPASWASDLKLHKIIIEESGGYVGRPNFSYDRSPLFSQKPRGISDPSRVDDYPKVWETIKNRLTNEQLTAPGQFFKGSREKVYSRAAGLGQLQPKEMDKHMPSGRMGIGDPHEEAVGLLGYIKERYDTVGNAYKFKFTKGGKGSGPGYSKEGNLLIEFEEGRLAGKKRGKSHGFWY